MEITCSFIFLLKQTGYIYSHTDQSKQSFFLFFFLYMITFIINFLAFATCYFKSFNQLDPNVTFYTTIFLTHLRTTARKQLCRGGNKERQIKNYTNTVNLNLKSVWRETHLKSLQSLSIPFKSPLPLALVRSFSSPTFISGLLSSSKGDTFSLMSLFSLTSWATSAPPWIDQTQSAITIRPKGPIQEWTLTSLKSMLTYISTIPVACVHLVTRRGAEHILDHAHSEASAFWARWKHRIGIPIPVETLARSSLHHDRLRHWVIWMRSVSSNICPWHTLVYVMCIEGRLLVNDIWSVNCGYSRDDPQALSLHSSPRSIPFRPSLASSSESQSFLAGRSCN